MVNLRDTHFASIEFKERLSTGDLRSRLPFRVLDAILYVGFGEVAWCCGKLLRLLLYMYGDKTLRFKDLETVIVFLTLAAST
jgi:hypothetical protein